MFIELLDVNKNGEPAYCEIKADRYPIYLFGCGDMAAQVLDYCTKYKIDLAGCVVNVRTDKIMFNGLSVIDMDALDKKGDVYSIIMGVAKYSLSDELAHKNNVSKVYMLSSMCYKRFEPVSSEFMKDNDNLLFSMYRSLGDDVSQRCLIKYFEYRINGIIDTVDEVLINTSEYYDNDIITINDNDCLIDVGAAIGGSVIEFKQIARNSRVVAIEPNREEYSQLLKNVAEHEGISCLCSCVWKKDEKVSFLEDGEEGGISSGDGTVVVEGVKLDTIVKHENIIPTVFKINFPFSLVEIFEGAEETINEYHPTVIIRAGWYEENLIRIYNYFTIYHSKYKCYLRYTEGIPQALTMFWKYEGDNKTC